MGIPDVGAGKREPPGRGIPVADGLAILDVPEVAVLGGRIPL